MGELNPITPIRALNDLSSLRVKPANEERKHQEHHGSEAEHHEPHDVIDLHTSDAEIVVDGEIVLESPGEQPVNRLDIAA